LPRQAAKTSFNVISTFGNESVRKGGHNVRTITGIIGMLLFLVGLSDVSYALPVTTTNPIRVDFTLPLDPPFTLPARILSELVDFGPTDRLNFGEGYEVSAFDAFGTFLGAASFTNLTPGSNIGGCNCTDEHLNPLLTTASGHLILTSLSGSFDVTQVFVIAVNFVEGQEDIAIGRISAVPEPATLTLLGLALAGLTAWRIPAGMFRRKRDH
jgi:hypothetical protein